LGLGDKKGMRPIKSMPFMHKCSIPEQEENRKKMERELANQVSPGK